MDRTKDIIKQIEQLSGSRSAYCVFEDWIKCMAIAISQTALFSPQREEQYLSTIKKYNEKEIPAFSRLFVLLVETMETTEMADILGKIYMQSGWGNKNTGQFFTPYDVSRMTAEVTYSAYKDKDSIISLNEPTAGAGGMVIAMADVMKNHGINYQKKLRVVAQEIDITACYMCFIQLSLYGIDAKCVQCNTLLNESFSVFDDNVMVTPMFMLNGASW